MMISRERLENIKARCDLATAGPWYFRLPTHSQNVQEAESRTICSSGHQSKQKSTGKDYDTPILIPVASIDLKPGVQLKGGDLIEGISMEIHGKPQDEMFITSARDDLPDCIVEIKRLNQRVQDLENELRG